MDCGAYKNPYLGEAIKYINENSNIEMGMFTNGTLLEKMKLMDVVDCLKWIRISIDAETQNYNKLRVTNKSNDFDTVKNIKKIIDIKNKKFKNNCRCRFCSNRE